MFVLTDEQKVTCKVEFKTAAGNPAKVDGVPEWGKNDPNAVLNITVASDGLSAVVIAAGPLGQAQIQVTADADLGEGKREITGVLDVEVKAAEAVTAGIVPGEPEPK